MSSPTPPPGNSDNFGAWEMELDEIVVGLYALRSFKLSKRGQLRSLVQRGGYWKDGVCEAVCTSYPEDPKHQVPYLPPDGEEEVLGACHCGIYGCFTLSWLMRQYSEWASKMVAVIAAEGSTLRGSKGIRTARARVVAYWVAYGQSELEEACAEQFPGATRYFDVDVMVECYNLQIQDDEEDD